MRKKKPFRILEEHLKYHLIVIELFKRRKIFSFGVSTSIGNGGIGRPEQGAYHSYFEAKNAASTDVAFKVQIDGRPGPAAVIRRFITGRAASATDGPIIHFSLFIFNFDFRPLS